jgi:hypothetical protein
MESSGAGFRPRGKVWREFALHVHVPVGGQKGEWRVALDESRAR